MAGRPVLYFTRMLTSYRVPVLEKLNKRLDGRLVVCHGSAPGASSMNTLTSKDETGFRQVLLKNYWVGGERIHYQKFKPAFEEYPDPAVILAEEAPRSISLPRLMSKAKKRKIPIVLWGHFSSNFRPFGSNHPADRYRIAMARKADACVCYSDNIAQQLREFVPPEKVFRARNTLDTDRLYRLNELLERQSRSAVRDTINLPKNQPVLCFIGRLIPDKGTDLLLDIFSRFRSTTPATLLVIGDGPELESMKSRVRKENIEDVLFTGAITDWSSSGAYLYASDVMLMPGYVGLSVNHAFCFGLPVVTHKSPDPAYRYHSPEIDFIEDGENGKLAEHGNEDSFIEAIKTVLDDRELFSVSAYATAYRYLAVGTMIDGLEHAILCAQRD